MTPEKALSKLDETFIGDLELKIFLTKALELQIPKEPIPKIDKLWDRVVSWTCPTCGNGCLGNNEFKFDCCEDCGQKLDWSNDDGFN